MEIFIDESGQFTPASGWSVVCALAVPSKEVGRVCRKLVYLTQDWPKAPSGELKGGSLDANHLAALVDLLFARDALLHVVAINMAGENDEGLKDHKLRQCELLTVHMTSEHPTNLVEQVWALRKTLELMPVQLYVQSVLMTELTAIAVDQITLYFSQRRPQELSNFSWVIDAKDPRRITTQEKWWRDTLGPLQESRSRREPLGRVNEAGFNYRFFDRTYEFEKRICYPDRPSELITGYDIRKIISDHISFKDLRSSLLLQAVDILTNYLRRLLMCRIIDPAIAHTLGVCNFTIVPRKISIKAYISLL